MFRLLLVILCIQTATPARPTLKVVFTMRKEGFGDTVGPALLGPLRKATQILDADIDWQIIDTNDTHKKVVYTFFNVISPYKPHVIIGENDILCCNTMGTLASATNTLYISIACDPAQYMMDRESYPTYTSARITSTSFGVVVDEVMKYFSWTRAAIISTANNQYPIRARLLKLELQKRKRKVFSYVHAASNGKWEDFLLRENAVRIMLEFLSGRVTFFVFLMDFKESGFMLKFATTLGLMKGTHAFLLHGLFEFLGMYVDDLTPFNGILTADRDVVTENQNYKLYTAAIRSDFDDVAWTNHTDWKRTIDFDNETPAHKSILFMSIHLRNAVALWVSLLKKAKDESPDKPLDTIARQGSKLSELSRNIEFDGITRRAVIRDGALGAHWMVSQVQNAKAENILLYKDDLNLSDYKHPKQLVWPGGSTTVPKEPSCFVDQCENDKERLLIIICCSLVGAIAVIIIIGVILNALWKRVQEKQIIANWRIVWKDVAMMAEQNTSTNASTDLRSIGSTGTGRLGLHISAALYKGTTIAIKPIPRDSVNIFERSIYNELKQLLHVKHDNINPFIGICVDAPNVCVAMAYAEKGSIQNVLADQQFDIDWEFRMSLALDVVQGMEYLHSTAIETHGHLTSANCVIDERWVCKITDYGLKLFRGIDKLQRPLIDLLWTAPEILRKKPNDAMRVNGTKPADVYSFGIIISELLTRELPYQIGMGAATLEELLAKVKMTLEPPFRPHLPAMEGNIAGEWIGLARNCWQTVPQKRPTFKTVKSILLANHSGKFTNVLERMQIMLEESVERANTDLLVERRKTEAMLESILPRPVVEKIASGTEFEPQLSDSVTLCLCDTIGFYKATSDLPADVVVDVLKSMYQQYDEIVLKYDAFEINTCGSRDMMMLTGGLSINPKVDAEAICTMSLELLSFMTTFTHPRIETKDIKMKTTIHTGSAYAALMGKQIPQLNVFGEVIPATTHLHQFGDAMVIRISSVTRDLLPVISGFKIQKADEITLNDSVMIMYMVTGKDGFTMPLPTSASPSTSRGRKSSSASPERKSSSASPKRKSSSASPKRKSSSASPKRKSSSASPKRKSSSASPEPTPGRKSSSKSQSVSPERKSSSVRRRSSGARSKKE